MGKAKYIGALLGLLVLVASLLLYSTVMPKSIHSTNAFSPVSTFIQGSAAVALSGSGNSSGSSPYTLNFNVSQIESTLDTIFPIPQNVNPIYFWLFVALIAVVINVLLALVPPFKEEKYKSARLIVSLIIALFAAETGLATQIVEKTSTVFGLLVVGLLMVLVIAYMVGGGTTKANAPTVISVIVFILFVAIALLFGGIIPNISINHAIPSVKISPTLAFMIGFIALLLIAGGGKNVKIAGIVLIVIAIVLAVV
ncbi:MAG: hypothetical protein QXP36_12405 [Conexivisphaerales archaeon]